MQIERGIAGRSERLLRTADRRLTEDRRDPMAVRTVSASARGARAVQHSDALARRSGEVDQDGGGVVGERIINATAGGVLEV